MSRYSVTAWAAMCARCRRSLNNKPIKNKKSPERKNAKIFDMRSCTCPLCVEMCKSYSCLPLPEEAQTLIDAGYGDRLMLDTRPSDSEPRWLILTLLPAMKGFERKISPMEIGVSPCVFLTEAGLCELHVLGLKPYEGRAVQHDTDYDTGQLILNMIKSAWNTREGHRVVSGWIAKYYRGDPKWAMRSNQPFEGTKESKTKSARITE